MILKGYVYCFAFILNYISFLKGYKRSFYSSIFFICENIVFVIIFNLIFNFMVNKYSVLFLNLGFLLFMFITSLGLYFLKRKYACITFSGTVVYFICNIFNFEVYLGDIMFLIGMLHIFEGIFVIFSFYRKMYLPLILNGMPIIFMIFYNRGFDLEMFKYRKIVSGGLILIYGIIVLIIGMFNNFLGLILICFLHESILLVEKFIFNKFSIFKVK